MSNDYVKAKAQISGADVDTSKVHLLLPLGEQQAKHFGQQRWGLFFLDSCYELAKLKLTGQEWQVLMCLFSVMDFGNRIAVSQSAVAADLEIAPARVSEAIKKLIRAGVLIEDKKIGTSRILRMNSKYAYRGRAKNVRKSQGEDKTQIEKMQAEQAVADLVKEKLAEIAKGAKVEKILEKIDDDFCCDPEWETERFNLGVAVMRKIAEQCNVESPI